MLEKWFEENSKISKHPTLVFSSSCISFFPLLFVSRLFIIIIILIIITSNPSLSGIALYVQILALWWSYLAAQFPVKTCPKIAAFRLQHPLAAMERFT